MSFGQILETQYDFENTDVILSLDADFLGNMPGGLKYSRQFSRRRSVHEGQAMNRLYAVESSPGLTGAMADHRLALQASDIASLAFSIADELGAVDRHGLRGKGGSMVASAHQNWIQALVRDLIQNRGRSLVIAGDYQPPEVHLLAHVMNDLLGNAGTTVKYTDSIEVQPVIHADSITELAKDMASGSVQALFVLGGNPVFTAPADISFSDAMSKVGLRVYLGHADNETAELCHWNIPESHYLESWGDARAFDGTLGFIQPLIAPLYATRTSIELLAAVNGDVGKSNYQLVKGFWQAEMNSANSETDWQIALHDGIVQGSAFAPKSPALRISNRDVPLGGAGSGLEVIFRPDQNIWDGRYCNNAWLQELPKPLTTLTWENAALLSPRTAQERGIGNGDVIRLSAHGAEIEVPAWIMPGHPKDSITLNLGYGHRRAGKIGKGLGVDVAPIRTTTDFWQTIDVQLEKTGTTVELAPVQDHHSMEGRHLVRHAHLEEFQAHPEMIHEMGHEPAEDMTLYPQWEYSGYSWGMAIDLNVCTGCNACTVACQAENNIPVVGKDEVLKGREMHWIRIDRYYEGELDHPEVHHQPMMCQHCENAPCEVVCPVAATTHSPEGLNEMVYNRCVGTRYCSNNCPYKVRRFNFFRYSDYESDLLKMVRNPDVTVRHRGIMEKCTYCVQRINHARIDAKKQDREIRDGDITTACQQVCPADAIVFGDINDPDSRVSKLKSNHRNYGVLTELNTRPRTTYLAKIKNPNPEVAES
jgi:molybdopterin-containing oxidoreductase family iron-sulfur binding subunit